MTVSLSIYDVKWFTKMSIFALLHSDSGHGERARAQTLSVAAEAQASGCV